MRTALMLGAAALLAPAAPVARAADDDFVTFRVMAPPLALEPAQAALKACRDRGYQVAVAVVDRFGVVQVMLRDVLAGLHTPDTALAKARTAVSFRAATGGLSAAIQAGQLNSAIRHIPV
ncbi:heme-binding protein [Caldovatus sp. SYSU G05006]|uniref:Heme-binding protein n=1 Tax=Caldovatus aquaticus TaxID=2865671 RepID=A0ABS7F3W7_9PROT|nr:heme-binding protein [Caldovatus aquaticus]